MKLLKTDLIKTAEKTGSSLVFNMGGLEGSASNLDSSYHHKHRHKSIGKDFCFSARGDINQSMDFGGSRKSNFEYSHNVSQVVFTEAPRSRVKISHFHHHPTFEDDSKKASTVETNKEKNEKNDTHISHKAKSLKNSIWSSIVKTFHK